MLQPEINQNQTQLEHSKLTLTRGTALPAADPARGNADAFGPIRFLVIAGGSPTVDTS